MLKISIAVILIAICSMGILTSFYMTYENIKERQDITMHFFAIIVFLFSVAGIIFAAPLFYL